MLLFYYCKDLLVLCRNNIYPKILCRYNTAKFTKIVQSKAGKIGRSELINDTPDTFHSFDSIHTLNTNTDTKITWFSQGFD